ncbi:MAG TPA: endo-1,4-beta-xylanase [Candidatus Saccharimonadales bacterium]|nr:endo-1,4-beta-xylanase [Candidatus Saccharimonadales bacterium]
MAMQYTPAPILLAPPLKELAARHGIELGNFAILNHMNDPTYRTILTTQFDFVLADNTPNWYFTDGGLRPSETTYNFKQMDEVVSYAQTHNMPIEAHHLLWGEDKWLPEWLKNGGYSEAQLAAIAQDHIATVAGRYKGQIKQWSVVNEAFTRGQHANGLSDWWADHTGGGTAYIDQAFIAARQADPHAKLILNDFNNEQFNPVSDAMYEYIKSAKARGIPIDGIGMQMHIDGTHVPDKVEVIANMQRFAALGVGVYVTEFDVNMSAIPANDTTKDNIAGDMYYNMMRACIESKVCHSFALLGITDKETWYNYMGPETADARPLMFDRAYQPKQAYYSFRAALEQ